MKKFWIILLMLCLCLFSCSCGRKPPGQTRVVTGVDVVVESHQGVIHRHYTKPHKIRQVLNYLRLQDSQGPADTDPERIAGPVMRIDVKLSDGSNKVYYQRSGRYLSRQYHPWQKIDPKQAAQFSQILQVTPTDA